MHAKSELSHLRYNGQCKCIELPDNPFKKEKNVSEGLMHIDLLLEPMNGIWEFQIQRLGVNEKSASLGSIRTWRTMKLERENLRVIDI